MQPRTKRQKQVLDFVTGFIDRNGHKPSYQQIALHLGVSSRGGVQRHIEALESQGLLTRYRENGRFGLELGLQKIVTDQVCGVELMEVEENGTGFAESDRSVITIPRFLIGDLAPDEVFALRVPDDSMLGRQICEDDIVVLHRRSYARRGEVVLARTDQDKLHFGLYNQLGRETEIKPANEEYGPFTFSADEIRVEGAMLGLLRFSDAFPQ
ncbi:MAG: LexA family protein [Pyrinomonadaceae bacterium]